jgi:hypothetical protein
MRRSWKALIVAAAVLLGTLGVMSLASASTDNTTVLHITGKILQTNFLDLGKKGLSPGDQFTQADALFMNGKRVGSDGFACTLTRVTGDFFQTQCLLTLRLPKGQITAQTLNSSTAKTFVFAITGGTGAYRDAGGYITSPVTEATTFPVTLFIDDLSS